MRSFTDVPWILQPLRECECMSFHLFRFSLLGVLCSLIKDKPEKSDQRIYIHQHERATKSKWLIAHHRPCPFHRPPRRRRPCLSVTEAAVVLLPSSPFSKLVAWMWYVAEENLDSIIVSSLLTSSCNVCVCGIFSHSLTHIYSPIYLSIYTFIHINSR